MRSLFIKEKLPFILFKYVTLSVQASTLLITLMHYMYYIGGDEQAVGSCVAPDLMRS